MSEFTLDELQPETNVNIALLSHSGGGKTWFAGTAPKPAFIDTDFKIQTLKQESFKKIHGYNPTIKVARFSDPVDQYGIFLKANAFMEIIDQINKWAEDPEVETVVIDTLTSLATLAMNKGIELNHYNNGKSKTLLHAVPERFGSNAKGHHALQPTEADFGAEMNLIDQLMTQLVSNVPKHIIVNCHLRPEYTDKGVVKEYAPLVTGRRTRANFGRWFHEVWALRSDSPNGKRYIQTNADALYPMLKTTLGLPTKIEEPDFPKVLKLIQEAQKRISNSASPALLTP